MSNIVGYKEDMKERFAQNLEGIFPKSRSRITIWAEVDKYKWKEDESVWKQKKGKTAPQYEVHFDGEFVMFLDSSLSDKYNISEFLINIRKLYNDGKIFVNTEMYEVKKAEAEFNNKEPELVIPEARNEAEDLIVKTIKKQAKRRKRKVKTK